MRFGRVASLAALVAVTAGVATGYHHFTHYFSRLAPFVAVPEKFDLAVLPNKTVPFYISETTSLQLASNDSITSVISHVRAAARVWNDVETSEIRIGFGGLFQPGTPQNSPVIEVTFEELPPGVVGYGGPASRADAMEASGGAFVPITRSIVVLPQNLTQRPSFGERFFLSALHEFGHALGLQHTLTSSAMATEVTRATTRALPLAADDVAGLSALYPSPRFGKETGVITGRVMMNGQPVNMASVVALPPSGHAFSALTAPDGTYRIAGVAPGAYYVYAHPIPPAALGESHAAGIIPPVDGEGRQFPPSGPFETMFYPNSRAPQQTVYVNVGSTADNINFQVRGRGPLQIYGVETYSFPGQVDVKPAFLSFGGPRSFIVARGVGLTSAAGAPVSGLSVSVIGGSASPQSVRAYPYASGFLQIDLLLNALSGDGPRHLIFATENDVYVLPSGLHLTHRRPPSVTSVSSATDSSGNAVLAISGSNLSAETRIEFDGQQAAVLGEDNGRLLVTPPPGPAGHPAAVVALNNDGQSSLFLQGANPATYTYEGSDASTFFVNPSSLPAGVEAMVEVTGANTNFAEGHVRLGFGSSDVVVKRVWVVSPTRLLANVMITPSAAAVSVSAAVANGVQLIAQPFAFQVAPANPRQATIRIATPAGSSAPAFTAGGTAQVQVSNLPNTAPQVTLNDRPATVISSNGGVITFQVPASFTMGPAVLRVQAGGESALPLVVAIDPPPATIQSVVTLANTPVDATRPVRPGDILTLIVNGLSDPGASVATSRLVVSGGGTDHQVVQVSALPGQPIHRVTFVLSDSTPGGSPVSLTVAIDHRPSKPYLLPVR